jgi:hypothetical protein
VRIAVRSRQPPYPWERDLRQAGAIRVGLEDYLTPDEGVLERYQTTWPHRWARWAPERQMWEIWERNPVTGRIERVTVVDRYVQGPMGLVPVYRPFDHEYVTERLRDRAEFLKLGPEGFVAAVRSKNERTSRSHLRDIVRELAAGLGELRRYWPVLAGDGPPIPQVPVEIDLKGGNGRHADG